MKQDDLDQLAINTIRMLAVDGVEAAKSGHPGMPLGDAAMTYTLWTRFLRFDPKRPLWPDRDRFVLSAGHGSMLLYSLLHLSGYDLSIEDLRAFRQWGSKTAGHPEYDPEIGIETTTGPLGQGFATGVGMAMAADHLAGRFNRPGFDLLTHRVYGVLSDGDMMEGISSEAASLAGRLGLGRIVYLYSDNKISIEGSTDLTFTEDVEKRFEAYGWHVVHVDGNDVGAVAAAIEAGRAETRRPSLLICRTHIGFGSPNRHDTADVHGAPLGPEESRLTKENLGWSPEATFHVPDEVPPVFEAAARRGADACSAWEDLLTAYGKQHEESSATWEQMHGIVSAEEIRPLLPSFLPADGPLATRSASGKALNALAPTVAGLIGGSADLAPSNNTMLKGEGAFQENPAGRNIHFGVREHAMGAILNGMAQSGALIPYGGTFLIFSDYMRPAIRLAALMGLRVVYVLTHDSIGLGEDGPTHQPIEHLSSLRAMPNLTVLRPADGNETSIAWELALTRTSGPTALVLTRQKLPVIDRSNYGAADGARRGGYVVADSSGGETPEIILIATGSEVHLAIGAHEELSAGGIRSRVVNLPSWEIFEEQDQSYRNEVLPDGHIARLAIEAGVETGWHKYVGLGGGVICMNRFGASAPGGENFRRFGFTVENVVARARELLGN